MKEQPIIWLLINSAIIVVGGIYIESLQDISRSENFPKRSCYKYSLGLLESRLDLFSTKRSIQLYVAAVIQYIKLPMRHVIVSNFLMEWEWQVSPFLADRLY
ncbi:hypothetical protein GQX74_013701 [Glossina fuscipes]|nr:hypothetical protein GQX74_013701 [Glossina fuscipes]